MGQHGSKRKIVERRKIDSYKKLIDIKITHRNKKSGRKYK